MGEREKHRFETSIRICIFTLKSKIQKTVVEAWHLRLFFFFTGVLMILGNGIGVGGIAIYTTSDITILGMLGYGDRVFSSED